MKKKVLAVAIASALTVPSAFAAQDTSGMQFTSASEGFYASIRARLDFSGDDDATANIDGNSSRFGVRGTNDLGGGLEGFYQYEAGVSIHNGGDLNTRLGHVGLRGSFGELVVGSFWSNDYNWVHGSTDIANNYSGSLVYNTARAGRTSRAIQYTTPDLNGFQAALRGNFDGGDTDNSVDNWNLSAIYNIQGFSVGGSYNVIADGIAPREARDLIPAVVARDAYTTRRVIQEAVAGRTVQDIEGNDVVIAPIPEVLGGPVVVPAVKAVAEKPAVTAAPGDDLQSWNVRLGYAQDNWYVTGWYGEDSNSDGPDSPDDTEIFSIAGGVAVQKVNIYALYETQEEDGGEESNYGTVGVQYNIGAQSRVWVEYFAQDVDDDAGAEDIISVGLRHDF